MDRLSIEYRYLHPDRGETWFHHVARVGSRDADGRAIGTDGVFRDITERERTQATRRLVMMGALK